MYRLRGNVPRLQDRCQVCRDQALKAWKIVVAGVLSLAVFSIGWWIGAKGFVWPDFGRDDSERLRLESEVDRLIELNRAREAEYQKGIDILTAENREFTAAAARDRELIREDAERIDLLTSELESAREATREAIDSAGGAAEGIGSALGSVERQGSLICELRELLGGLQEGSPDPTEDP